MKPAATKFSIVLVAVFSLVLVAGAMLTALAETGFTASCSSGRPQARPTTSAPATPKIPAEAPTTRGASAHPSEARHPPTEATVNSASWRQGPQAFSVH